MTAKQYEDRGMDALDLASSEQDLPQTGSISMIFSK